MKGKKKDEQSAGMILMPPCKPHLNKAIIEFLHDYENNMDSYVLEKDCHEIKLTIKLLPTEKTTDIKDLL